MNISPLGLGDLGFKSNILPLIKLERVVVFYQNLPDIALALNSSLNAFQIFRQELYY